MAALTANPGTCVTHGVPDRVAQGTGTVIRGQPGRPTWASAPVRIADNTDKEEVTRLTAGSRPPPCVVHHLLLL